MLLMVEKGIRGGIDMQNLTNLCKITMKIQNRHILNIEMQIIVCLGNVTKVAFNYCKWVEDISEFDESLTKCCNEESDEGFFF